MDQPILTPDHLPPEWRELYEERAAIMEYDGNLPRAEAERLALECIVKQMREKPCE